MLDGDKLKQSYYWGVAKAHYINVLNNDNNNNIVQIVLC